jgi:hypothetical protein
MRHPSAGIMMAQARRSMAFMKDLAHVFFTDLVQFSARGSRNSGPAWFIEGIQWVK